MQRSIECLKHRIALFTILLIATTVSAQKPIIEWAIIPAGTFTIGSPENEVNRGPNETQHQVSLSAFKMSKHEITVAQFKAFVEATGYVTDADKNAGGVYGSAIMAWKNMEYQEGVNWKCDIYGIPKPAAEYNHPVIHVSWNDAVAFAEWMGCRLPTESEWEYACRAGTTTPFHTGNNLLLRKLTTMAAGHTTTIQRVLTGEKRCRLAVFLRMHGDCTICTGMYGSGAGIGLVIIPPGHKPIRWALPPGRAEWPAAVAGSLLGRLAGRRPAATAAIQSAASAS